MVLSGTIQAGIPELRLTSD